MSQPGDEGVVRGCYLPLQNQKENGMCGRSHLEVRQSSERPAGSDRGLRAPKFVHRPKTTTWSGVFWPWYLPALLYLSVSYSKFENGTPIAR